MLERHSYDCMLEVELNYYKVDSDCWNIIISCCFYGSSLKNRNYQPHWTQGGKVSNENPSTVKSVISQSYWFLNHRLRKLKSFVWLFTTPTSGSTHCCDLVLAHTLCHHCDSDSPTHSHARSERRKSAGRSLLPLLSSVSTSKSRYHQSGLLMVSRRGLLSELNEGRNSLVLFFFGRVFTLVVFESGYFSNRLR